VAKQCIFCNIQIIYIKTTFSLFVKQVDPLTFFGVFFFMIRMYIVDSLLEDP